MPVVMTGWRNGTHVLVGASKRSIRPSGRPHRVDRAAAFRQHRRDTDVRVVDRRVVAQGHVYLGRWIAGLDDSDGMPLIVTEIRASAGTGRYSSAVCTGSVFGLTAQPAPCAAADGVGLVGAVCWWLVEQPVSATVAAMAAPTASRETELFTIASRSANMSASRLR